MIIIDYISTIKTFDDVPANKTTYPPVSSHTNTIE